MATTTEKIKISLQADVTQTVSQLNKVRGELKALSQDSSIKLNLVELNKLISDIDKVKKAMKSSTAIGSKDTLNTNQFKSFEKNLGTSLDSIINKTNKFYKEAGKSNQVITDQAESLSRLEAPAKRGATAIDKLGISLTNSLRYNIVNNFVDSFLSKGGEVVDLLSEVDDKLTQIQIVSGKSAAAVQDVRENALIDAKNLASTTQNVLSAYEAYYQQGLSANEAKSRAEATIMASNVSNQSVETTTEQVTAVLNGFNVSAEYTVDVLGKMANIGARTATDFSEIASAMQKVASASDVAGLSLDDTLAAMATISSVTREAPETIGTSLNAILGRIGNLKVDDGYTSAIEEIYKSTNSGLTLFDKQTGLLKEAGTILSDLAEKWDILDINQKRAITSQLAGTRQANRMLALMENWDMFEQYRNYAANSENALEEQNDIYLQSVEAAQNRMETAWDTFWLNLFDEDALKGFYDFSADMIELFDNATQSAGGLLSVIRTITGLMSKTIGKQLGNYVGASVQTNVLRRQIKTSESQEAFKATQSDVSEALKSYGIADLKLLNELERQVNLTEEQKQQYANLSEELIKLTNNTLEYKKILNSPVFKNIKVGKFVNGEKETEELTSATSFMNYAKGVIDPTISGARAYFEGGDSNADLMKDILFKSKDDLESIKNKYSGHVDTPVIEEYYTNLNSLKDLLTQFSNTSNEVIQNVLKTTKEDIKTTKEYQEELRQKYSDIYDNRKSEPIFKESVQKIIDKQSTGKTLNAKEQDIFDRAQLAQTEEKAKKAITVSLQKIIESGFDLATLDLDGKVDDEQFFNALIKMIKDGFKKMQNESVDGGMSIAKQADEETKGQKNYESNKRGLAKLRDKMYAITQGAEANKWTQRITNGLSMATAAATGLTQAFDDSISSQEQLSIGVNALGSALSVLPGVTGAIGLALSTLGPLFIETFGIGEDSLKKLQKQIDSVKESNDALTLSVKEQKSELSNINSSYISLVDAYENNKLDLKNLTEAQKQQYEQVAEYVSVYAPELVKYYDTEGNAVIDLTNKYDELSKTKKSYLQVQAEKKEQQIYESLRENANSNAQLLAKNYGANLKNVKETQEKIAELQKESLETGKNNTEQISKYNEKLVQAKDVLGNIASDWNDMVTKPLTLGTEGFTNLSTELQNSLNYTTSYQNYLSSDALNEDFFVAKTQTIIDTVIEMSDKTQKKFTEMDENLRNTLFSMATSLDYTKEEFKSFFEEINEESYLKGDFFNSSPMTEEENSKRETRKRDRDIINEADFGEFTTNVWGNREQTAQEINRLAEAVEEDETEEKLKEIAEQLSNEDWWEVGEGISEAIGKINELQDTLVTDVSTDWQDELAAWRDSIVDYAESSNEAYNSVAESFLEMQRKISEGQGEMSDEEWEAMQEKASNLYLALNSQNTEYYDNWKKLNANTLNEIQESLNINADNYETYTEYKSALDEAFAQRKLYVEVAANEGIDEANKILFDTKKQNLANELLAYRDTETAAILLSSKGADAEVNLEKAKKIAVLQGEKEKLLELKKSLQAQVDANANATSEQIRQYNAGIDKINEPLASLANMGVSQISKVGTTTVSAKALEKTIDAAISSIDDGISNIRDSMKIEDQEAYKSALKALNEIKAMEDTITNDFKYQRGDYGNIEFKKPSKPSKPNNTAGVGKGGGKKKKDKGSKEVEDMELELDILRPYIIALEELEHELDIVSEKKEQVWGKQYVDYLNQELEINKNTLNVLKEKMKAAQNYANVLKQQLSSQGVKFTDYGAISNYNEILQSKVNAANAKSGDAKKEAQNAVKSLQSLMDKYEKYALETVRDIEKEILDTQNNIAEAAQEKIEYYVEIIVETKDNKNDLLDFLADVQKYKKGEINFSIDVSNNADKLINSLNSLKEIESKTSVDNLIKQVTESLELQGMTDKQLEIIQNRIEELQKLGSELIEFEEAFTEAFADAFDEAMDLLDDQLSKYDNILNQYNYILDLAEKLGNNKDLDFNTQTYDKIISIYKNNLEASKQLAEDIKTSRDQFEVGTKDWQIANEKYLEAQSNVIDQEKELTEALENKFDSTVSIGRDQIENMLFNGGTLEDAERELEKLNKLRDKYLDKEQKIYSLDKMKYQIMKDMDEYEYNPAAQKELEDWMNKELDYLNNKKDLTQDDLDLAEKQYAVMKARIDMENAYNNKKYTATLQRNADGTYGYMYIQDTSQYEAASQSYRDAIDELYNYSLERNEALQQENIELKQEALEEYDRIVAQLKAGMITSEEATKLLQETFNKLQENLKQNAAEQEQISQNAVAATQLQILMNELMNTESMDRIQNISSETQQIINDNLTAAGMSYDEFVNSKLYQELSREDMFTADITEEWNKLDELINNDMDSIANDFNFDNENSMISQIVNSINSAYKEFNDVVTDAFQNAIDREEELINSTGDLNKQTAELNKKLQDEINKVTELKKQYNDLRTNITKALDEITNSLNKLASAHTNVKNAANKGNTSTSKPSSSSGSSSSSSKPSSSSSSSSSLKKGSAVKVKSGRRWYHDSTGRNPSGPTNSYANRTLYVVNTSSNSYPYAVGTTKSVNSALGWLKKSDLVGYDTGGYTGDWYGNEGKLALLHKKEIILKEEDTKNFLQGIELSNELLKEKVQSYKIDNNKNSETVNYNEFKIDFPNATNHNEIQKAIEGLSVMATQYIGRKK